MARATGLYSRVIAWLKILLPLAALALLSTLFLLSSSREPLDNVPFAAALRAGDAAQQGVSGPYYSGTTAQGEILTMTAKRARPMADGRILADALEARMQLRDGSEIRLNALEAHMQEGEQTAHLKGGVRIESSLGYILRTEAMISALDSVEVESLGPVVGDGPAGELRAGRLRISPAAGKTEVQIHFTDGVKLIYRPPKKDETE